MNIIINGGSRGIGKEVAILMARDSSNQILVTGRDKERLRELEIIIPNKNVSCINLDISRFNEEIVHIKEKVFNRFSKVDILLNIAGLLIIKDFMYLSDSEARNMMETNFFGPAAFVKLLVPIMPSGSHIINISSMGGYQGSSKYKGMAGYSASKAALACLTECLAVELVDHGISVNCLALGSVQTEMFERAFPGFKAPLGPELMAEFISYFAVNGNRFFNGKILPVAISNP